MAQGDLWQLGIEVPVRNNKFDDFAQRAYFESDTTSGARVFTVDKDGTDIDLRTADYVLTPGIEVTLGPSTYSGFEGAVETVTVSVLDQSGSTYYFDATANLLYDYSEGDQIQFKTKPVGWTANLSGGYLDSRKYSMADPYKYGNSAITYGAGHSVRIDRTAASTSYVHSIIRKSGLNTLLNSNGVHRASVWAKSATIDLGYASCIIGEYTANDNQITTNQFDVDPGVTWALKSTTFTPNADANKAEIDLRITNGVAARQVMDFYSPIIEHAAGTSGSGTGYVALTEYPESGSIRYDKLTMNNSAIMLNNTRKDFDASGGRIRHWMTAEFLNVSQATYDDFMQLERACIEDGANIVLRPNIDDLPPVMIGKIKISNAGKTFWNFGYRSFSFRFEEV